MNFAIKLSPAFSCTVLDCVKQGEKALRDKSLKFAQAFQGKDRAIENIDGIVLHQMGFQRGHLVERYYAVTAHYIILPNGLIAQLHGHEEYLYSSNGLNATTVAVEFAGNLKDDRGRWWKNGGKDELTSEQVAAGRFLLRHVLDHYGISKIYAHRQAHERKTNCCGPEIWFNVGEFGIGELGFEDCRELTVGKGTPIPQSWRINATDKYFI